MPKNIDEKETVYAALKLIENLYKMNKIKRHVFLNILNEYKSYVDISEFKCYT